MIDMKKAEKIYKKSLKILKKSQLKNGGCLATPPGKRYPYIYPRDHSMIILAFLSAGFFKRAKRGIDFILRSQLKNGSYPQRLDKKGKDASYKPVQIDNSGLVLYVFSEYVFLTKDFKFAEKNWEKIIKSVEYIIKNIDKKRNLIFCLNSIHEFPPIEEGFEIWANSACCSGLRKTYELGLNLRRNNKKWLDYCEKIKKGILRELWNHRLGRFIKTIRVRESSSIVKNIDISEYAPLEFEILDEKNEKIKSTVEKIEKELWHKRLGGICRYPKYIGRNNGGWGPWFNYTLMLARYFIRTKNRKKSERYINWILKNSYKKLLPEHISTKKEFEEYVNDFEEADILRKDRELMIKNTRKHPMYKKGIAYITLPLVWSHAEFVRSFNLYKKTF